MYRVALVAVLLGVLGIAAPMSARAQSYEPSGALSEPVYSESVTEEFRVGTDAGSIYGWVKRPVVPDGVKSP